MISSGTGIDFNLMQTLRSMLRFPVSEFRRYERSKLFAGDFHWWIYYWIAFRVRNLRTAWIKQVDIISSYKQSSTIYRWTRLEVCCLPLVNANQLHNWIEDGTNRKRVSFRDPPTICFNAACTIVLCQKAFERLSDRNICSCEFDESRCAWTFLRCNFPPLAIQSIRY